MDSLVNFANGLLVETLTGNRTITKADPIVCKLDPGGANRDVTLDAAHTGGIRVFINAADAAENLVVKNAAGSTIGTANQNEAILVMADSVTGAWTLGCLMTIALS
jgi:hypothetical protein